MVHGSDARAMASVRGLLNIQSLNESSTHEKSPFNAPCHIWCYGPVCVSARDSARCLRGADHAIRWSRQWRAVRGLLCSKHSVPYRVLHAREGTDTWYAVCAVRRVLWTCADRRPPCSGSAETGRVPRRKAGRALDNDSRSISLLSYIAGASRASSALSTSSRIHHIRYLLQYHVALRPVAT